MSVIPQIVWNAAKTLYDYTPSYAMRDQLGLLIEQKTDLTRENPFVKLYHTIDTGSCLIYLSEIVTLSTYLFLMLKEANYRVTVIPNSQPLEIPFSNVYIKKWSGKESGTKTQSFYCDDIIRNNYMIEDYEAVMEYVKRLGPLNPDEAVTFTFIEFHLEGLRNYGKRPRTE